MRITMIQRLGAVLCLLGVVFWMTAGALLHASADEETTGTLTLICETVEGVKLGGMHWDVFRIGGRNADGDYELQGAFAEYPVSLEDTSTTALAHAAETLDAFAVADGIAPLASANANENGWLKFTNLSVGLYLIAGDCLVVDNTHYYPASFLLEVTEGEGADNIFDMTAHPKYIYKSGSEYEQYTVKKVWQNDENNPENRSTYITVEIYRDKELYETITLDESNDWTYSWEADKPYKWQVHEVDIPDKYSVVYRSQETQFLIINTYEDVQSNKETTTVSDSINTETTTVSDSADNDRVTTPSDDSADKETTTVSDSADNDRNTTTTTRRTTARTTTTRKTTTTTTTAASTGIPQTGQLWWPVPVLALAGLVLMAIGFRMSTKE